jgi:hypothetical protein
VRNERGAEKQIRALRKPNVGGHVMRKISVLLLNVSLVLALLLGGCGGGGDSPTPGSDPGTQPPPQPQPQLLTGADWIESRLAEFDSSLYVYRDFADGANYYIQKAWIGDNYSSVPAMREGAEGINGTTGVAAEINLADHEWGGYMFINGVLRPGATVPELDFGASDAGLDLRGAAKLTFCARGETGGERVEFFMGGLGRDGANIAPYPDTSDKRSLGYVSLSNEWRRYEIPLAGADLSRIGCGFGWAADRINNTDRSSLRFYLDDIKYEFGAPRLRPMFLASYAPAPQGTSGAAINNIAYLYDNAAAAMALSYAGKHERARQNRGRHRLRVAQRPPLYGRKVARRVYWRQPAELSRLVLREGKGVRPSAGVLRPERRRAPRRLNHGKLRVGRDGAPRGLLQRAGARRLPRRRETDCRLCADARRRDGLHRRLRGLGAEPG